MKADGIPLAKGIGLLPDCRLRPKIGTRGVATSVRHGAPGCGVSVGLSQERTTAAGVPGIAQTKIKVGAPRGAKRLLLLARFGPVGLSQERMSAETIPRGAAVAGSSVKHHLAPFHGWWRTRTQGPEGAPHCALRAARWWQGTSRQRWHQAAEPKCGGWVPSGHATCTTLRTMIARE
jgi:hypothetical protein